MYIAKLRTLLRAPVPAGDQPCTDTQHGMCVSVAADLLDTGATVENVSEDMTAVASYGLYKDLMARMQKAQSNGH